ncbi:MAG: DMT family transporter [Burkholderiaceae bacterium]|jgi:drug/metabolite transporter (DMT)-like permease
MSDRIALDARGAGLMTLLCFTWGLQQAVLKLAAPDVSPLMQIAVRSGVAALLVGLLVVGQRQTFSLTGPNGRSGLLVGSLFALEFFLVGEALRHTAASHVIVLLYTAPMFVALGLHWKIPAERLNRVQWLGIVVAFLGIAITFLWRKPPATDNNLPQMLWGDLLAVAAGAAWAATTVAVRLTGLSRAPAKQTLLYQLVWGCLFLSLAALLLDQATIQWTPLAISALLFQSIVVSFASFLVWFWLLTKYLASSLGAFSFLTPLFGVVVGVWLLNETLEPGFIAGSVLVLTGVATVSAHTRLTAFLKRRGGSALS